MPHALVGLGANLGDRARQLEKALQQIGTLPNVQRVRVSRFVASRPVGGPTGQPEFLNAAAVLQVTSTPQELWAALAQIEHSLGRSRGIRWAARPIDLDLLLFDVAIVESPELTIPHPRLAVRRFVLEPAVEIAAAMVHPRLERTIGQLWEHLCHAPPRLHLFGVRAELREKLRTDLRSWTEHWTVEDFAELSTAIAPVHGPPKLRVLLDEPTPAGVRLRQAFDALRGVPSLILDTASWPTVWDEVTAALTAMA